MHQGVLQNKSYIRFAEKNTVEVICMQDLDRALADNNPQIKTYQARDRYGDDVAYLLKFPGLTVDDIRNLANSDALEYMEGRLMPATVVVNPHTLEKMGGIMRGMNRTPQFVAAIEPHVKELKTRYGPGIDRKLWDDVSEGQVVIDRMLGDGKIVEAMGVYRTLGRGVVRQPDALKRRVEASLEVILDDAKKRLDELEGSGRKAAGELNRLARALRDTPLEKRALDLVSALKKKS